MLDKMSEGNKYLLERYANQQLSKELLFYKEIKKSE